MKTSLLIKPSVTCLEPRAAGEDPWHFVNHSVRVGIILNSIGRVAKNTLFPVASAEAGIAFEPRTLLSLLTYCYSMGVLSSRDIESCIGNSAFFRLVCQDEFPDWHTIRRFRRHNREVLRQCLQKTCLELEELRRPARASAGNPPVDGAEEKSFVPEGIMSSADDRIEEAVWLDSVALDH
jgi:hypothetical protein